MKDEHSNFINVYPVIFIFPDSGVKRCINPKFQISRELFEKITTEIIMELTVVFEFFSACRIIAFIQKTVSDILKNSFAEGIGHFVETFGTVHQLIDLIIIVKIEWNDVPSGNKTYHLIVVQG